MAVQPTYPGVYVQEVPSGVRTIVGVATSIAMFIGRASRGPLNRPVLCLNPSDFERVFSNDITYSDLARSIRLFFQNGGTQCYVMRIAEGADAASVSLRNENGDPVMFITAKDHGVVGDTIRLAVTYTGQQPETNFNLEIFRWETNNAGQQVKAGQEVWQGLSMNPASPRYADSYISQNSSLINLTDLNAGVAPADPGISRAGRATPDGTDMIIFRAHWQAIFETGIGQLRLLSPWDGTSAISPSGVFTGSSTKLFRFSIEGAGNSDLTVGTDNITIGWSDGLANGSILIDNTYIANTSRAVHEGLEISLGAGTLREGQNFTVAAHPLAYRFRMSANGGRSWADVTFLDRIDFSAIAATADLVSDIQTVIDEAFSAGTVAVTLQAGPTGTQLLQFACNTGDVRIEPAVSNDLARVLMLGSAQGGVEISRYASRRPAATGLVFNLTNWNNLAVLDQDDFDTLTIAGETIDLTDLLETVHTVATAPMYWDGMNHSPSGGYDGIREKLAILANAVNSFRLRTPGFIWEAEVAGNRLVLSARSGGDNIQGSLTTSNSGGGGTNLGPFFRSNVRYYTLGANGQGNFQIPGTPGDDGNAPGLNNYLDAFTVIEQEVDLFNLMILPRDANHDAATIASIWGPASIFCQQQRAFLLMDPPDGWTNAQTATHPASGVNSLRIGLVKDHSAVYYPRVIIRENGLNVPVGPSGAIAGLMSRIDSNRGVWKAPAGTEADIRGVVGLEYRFSDGDNGVLNPQGVNTLRVFPNGIVSWGARTMDGDDDFASEWKYVPVRRLALFMEESLYRGLQWVVFEPNDEPLWSQIRLNVGAFMNNLFRQGAFQGQKRSDAYFVKCDNETTTQNDINLGIVNVWVGFAPLKPAEFVIIRIQQIAGQIEV